MGRVVLQPQAGRGFRRGVNELADTIRPTLGPRPRTVAVAALMEHKPPELLDEGGVIARRIQELPNRNDDVGAMFLREVLTTLHEQVGDGAATAAVIFQALYNEGMRQIVAGVDPVRLRGPLEHGLGLILDELDEASRPVGGQPVGGRRTLARIANSIVGDAAVADLLAEIFEVIGPFGRLEIRSGKRRHADREYVEGVYWQEGVLSRAFLPGLPQTSLQPARVELQDAAILVTNLNLDDPYDVLPLMTQMLRAGRRRLMIVANQVSEGVLALFHANQNPEKFHVIAVKTPHALMPDRAAVLHDMALLVGGRPLVREAGDTFRSATLEHLGYAERAWADATFFGVAGAKGNREALEEHLVDLKLAYRTEDDAKKRRELLGRVGRLSEGSATLWVGGVTEHDLEMRKNMAIRAAETLREALTEGVVAGGRSRAAVVLCGAGGGAGGERGRRGAVGLSTADPCAQGAGALSAGECRVRSGRDFAGDGGARLTLRF